jgi:hypothetical protein
LFLCQRKLVSTNTYLKSKIENNEVVILIENKINNNYTIELFKERAITPINLYTIENSIVLKPYYMKKILSVKKI